jgi:hypothetical protein
MFSRCRVVAGSKFRDSCRVRRGAQDMAYLGGFRERVKVCSRSRISSRLCCAARGFGACFFRCAVRVQGSDALKIASRRAIDEGPRSTDRVSGSLIVRLGIFEHRKNVCCRLDRVMRNDSQLVNGQVEVTRFIGHIHNDVT